MSTNHPNYLCDSPNDDSTLRVWKETGRSIVDRLAAHNARAPWIKTIKLDPATLTVGYDMSHTRRKQMKRALKKQKESQLPEVMALARLRFVIEHHAEGCYDGPLYREIAATIAADRNGAEARRLIDEKEKTLVDQSHTNTLNAKKRWTDAKPVIDVRNEQAIQKYKSLRANGKNDVEAIDVIWQKGEIKALDENGKPYGAPLSKKQLGRIIPASLRES